MYSYVLLAIVDDRQNCTHVVVAVFWKDGVELLQELHHLVGSIAQLMNVAIGVDIAEAGAHRLINKEQVRKFGPRTVVVCQSAIGLDSVGADLHHGTIHRTTSRASVEPQYCALLVCDMTILVVPEEEVPVVFGCDFHMT